MKMTTPKKDEILRRGKAIAMERQIRAGLPAITPSERELKESGMFQEAQIDLMRVDQEALSQQRRYLSEMASDLKLVVLPKKGLATLKRETGYEWTNGWTKHEKPKPRKKKEPKTRSHSEIEKWIKYREKYRSGQWKGGMEKFRKRLGRYKASLILGREFQEPVGIFLERKGLKEFWEHDLGLGKITRIKKKLGEPIIHRMTREARKLPSIKALSIVKPKKRRNSHVERSGKTMRALRKIDGVKVFSFPDSVWKVRKPRKRRRK